MSLTKRIDADRLPAYAVKAASQYERPENVIAEFLDQIMADNDAMFRGVKEFYSHHAEKVGRRDAFRQALLAVTQERP